MTTEIVGSEANAPEVDPEQPVAQTEDGQLPSPAESAPAAAATDDDAPLTQAEFDRRWQEREAELRQKALGDARELERRARQAEEGRKAAEARQRTQLRDAVQVSLIKGLGVTDVDDEVADDIISRVRGIESSTVEANTEAAISEAVAVAAAQAIGLGAGDVSPEAQRYVTKFRSYMERLLAHEAVREFIVRDEKAKWQASLPTLQEAQRAQARPKGEPVVRPDGVTQPLDTSKEARLQRLAFGNPSEEDRKWHQDTYGHL